MGLTHADRYKEDPVYRQKAIDRVKSTHAMNMALPVYRELRKMYTTIENYEISIELHRRKIKMFQQRLKKAIRKKEELQLEFGKIRSERKRGNILV
jgi:hypothetical protein